MLQEFEEQRQFRVSIDAGPHDRPQFGPKPLKLSRDLGLHFVLQFFEGAGDGAEQLGVDSVVVAIVAGQALADERDKDKLLVGLVGKVDFCRSVKSLENFLLGRGRRIATTSLVTP